MHTCTWAPTVFAAPQVVATGARQTKPGLPCRCFSIASFFDQYSIAFELANGSVDDAIEKILQVG